ncbi:MAG: FAD binding domain-containing protein [Gemmatimonadota bacterium]|nr:FAD binding domain-containing protein [Gemmatimonadota bacterium]
MLRLHEYRYHRPRNLAEACALLAGREDALPIAGGTDLVPNMKHRLWTPRHLVGLKAIAELQGVGFLDASGATVADHDPSARTLAIGAAATLSAISRDPRIRRLFPSLATAAGKVAGPQIRNQGTLGGNLCLDTRCTYYNQSLFWRQALGFCLKKDGDICHVTRVGKKCVAANSADTPPVLMTLGAVVDLASAEGGRTLPVESFFLSDGSWNTVRAPHELVVRVRIPLPAAGLRTSYQKLRQRGAIDFPLLSVATAAEVEEDETVRSITVVVSALGARPRVVAGLEKVAVGGRLSEVSDAVAEHAHRQCHPLENLIVDAEWRRAMVPIYVRRALEEMGRSSVPGRN